MSRPLRVAIAGLGRWGPVHLATFARLGDVEITALADPDAPRLRSHATPGRRLFASALDAVAHPEIDAVVLATPSTTHAELTELALDNGKHVLVEKPLGFGVTEAERAVRAAASSRAVGMMGHVLEHHGAFVALRALVDRGALGAILHVEATRHAVRRTRDDPWWALAPHDLGVCLQLLGTPVRTRLYRDTGVARASLTFPTGTEAQLSVAFGASQRVRLLRVTGTTASALLDDAPDGANLWLVAGDGRRHRVPLPPTDPPVLVQARAFVDACRTGSVPVGCTLSDGLAIVRSLAAAAGAQNAAPVTRQAVGTR